MGELHGGSEGMKCEHKSGCDNRSWTVFLTDEENKLLPEQSGPEAALFINQQKLGVVLCREHSKEANVGLPDGSGESVGLQDGEEIAR